MKSHVSIFGPITFVLSALMNSMAADGERDQSFLMKLLNRTVYFHFFFFFVLLNLAPLEKKNA